MSIMKNDGTEKKVNVDDIFRYNIALNVINNSEDHELKSTKDCRQSENWPNLKDEIEAELNQLYKSFWACSPNT